jgi:F0F1-type ATP synthase assembly protein I
MASADHSNDAWSGMGTGWSITSTMIGGIAAFGGLGFLADWLLGTPHVFTGIGFVVGAAGGSYSIWLRYGKEERGDG